MNVKTDWESRNVTKSFDCKLLQKVFLKITKVLGTPSIDLFASRLCHQLLQYMAWKPVLQQIQYNRTGTNVCFPFPPSSLIGRVINKALRENVEAMILVTLTCQTQPWYTLLLRISIQRPLLLPALPNLFLNPLGEKHPPVKTRSLRLVAWKITGETWKWKEFQAMQPNLSPCPGDQVLLQVTSQPGTRRLADVANNKLIQFVRLYEKGLQYRTIKSHRSSTSLFHDYVDGKPLRKHPRVCA